MLLSLVLSVVLVQVTINKEKEDARIINRAGRQRMLSQNLSKNALALEAATNAYQTLQHRYKIGRLGKDLKESHELLRVYMEEESLLRSKNAALPILFTAIDTSLQAIYQSSQQIASLEHPDSISLFTQNILAHEATFLSYMERIVKGFELEASNQVDLLQKIVYGLNAFLATMFLLTFYGIIRPMFSRLDKQNKSLLDKNEALKKQQQRLEEQATYIREQNGQLVQAKKKAEQEAAAKTAFLSNMSHEIRTPMNAVIGMTNILLQSAPRPDQLDHLKTIGFSAENLLVVINDILDFSKIEAGKLEIEYVNFNILEACQNIYRTLEAKAQDKNLHFRLDFDEDIPNFVVGDPTRLSQILINLLNNALKFTPKGHVIFQVKKLHNGDGEVILQFLVQDTGIGIPKEKQDMIFESFSQTDTKTTRLYGGTGLGLAITKRLLELQGSSIRVNSEVNVGSTFYFNMLYQIGEKPVSQIIDKKTPPKDLPKFPDGKRILLVEDNPMNVKVAMHFLKIWNLFIEVATDGEEALRMVQESRYDLVLMDLQMPRMDGYEATRQIRQLNPERYQRLPIVALSASALSEFKVSAFEAGMNDFLSKPFRPFELHQTLNRYLGPNTQKRAVLS